MKVAYGVLFRHEKTVTIRVYTPVFLLRSISFRFHPGAYIAVTTTFIYPENTVDEELFTMSVIVQVRLSFTCCQSVGLLSCRFWTLTGTAAL